MIVHGATIAAIFVAILSALEDYPRVADGYELPEPTFELLQPKGIKIWIPHEEGIEFFSFGGNVNLPFGNAGMIGGLAYADRRGKWTAQDKGANVRNGDTIYYYTYVIFNGMHYPRHGHVIINVKGYGKPIANKLVFIDNFLEEPLDPSIWESVIKFPLGPDYEFCGYHNRNHTGLAEIVDGVLRIKPLILDDRYGEGATAFGNTQLAGCTSIFPAECERKATGFNILPPIISARFTTKESFNFRYGEIVIRAKFPEGDWLYPEMWLEPLYDNYDAGYSSGRVLLGLARGNDNLINATSGEIFDSRKLDFGLRISAAGIIRNYIVSKIENPRWTKEFHVYTTIWNSDGFQFLVDDEEVGKLVPEGNGWMNNQFNKMAPFHDKFYITIGLGVGGIRIFPDGTISSGFPKPWRNPGAKAMLKFWHAKDQWSPSWKRQNGKKTAFEIDYIQVWSFN